jgi:hypothetical protein
MASELSRRDLIAAHALQGLLSAEGRTDGSCDPYYRTTTDRDGTVTTRYQLAARSAVAHADALIEALDAPAHEVADGE